MPPEKKAKKSGPKKTADKWKPVPTNFNPAQLDGLDEIAKAERKTRSEVIRDAVDIYLRNFKEGKYQSKESEVARELRRIEKRLTTLLIKTIKIGGQSLYFTTLPYTTGLPKGRIQETAKTPDGKPVTEIQWARVNQMAFNQYFDKSHAFAVQLMRAKSKKDEDLEEISTPAAKASDLDNE